MTKINQKLLDKLGKTQLSQAEQKNKMKKINQKLLDKLGKAQLLQAEQKILNSRWQQFLNFFNFFGLDTDFKTAQKKLTEASLQIKGFLEENLSPDQIKYLNLRTAIGGTTKPLNSHYILYPPSISDMLETFHLTKEQKQKLKQKFSIDLKTILSNILEAKDINFMPQTKFIKFQEVLASWHTSWDRARRQNAYTQKKKNEVENALSKSLETTDVVRLGSHDLNMGDDNDSWAKSVNATRQTQNALQYTSAINKKDCRNR